jgi:hypothetical protein
MTVGRRARTGLLLAGVVGALFALSFLGLATLGAPSGGVATTNAGLSAASSPGCPATVTVSFAPATILTHAPMTVKVTVLFTAGVSAVCAHAVQVFVLGLPAGCGVETSMTSTCVPQAMGTFHVQTTVIALNTASTVVDTLVVR